MMEVVRTILSVLILVFSGLTFWHQFLRTPRSNVGMNIVGRDEPYTTKSANITFRGPPVQIYNRGDMEAIVAKAEVKGTLVEKGTGESFDPPQEDMFKVSIREGKIGSGGKLSPGRNTETHCSIVINSLSHYPPEFYIKLSYHFEIRDNNDTYELFATDSFKFVNQRVAE